MMFRYFIECDNWSLGVILYVMLSGKPPFQAATKMELVRKIKNENPSFKEKIWKEISTEAKDLISKLLIKSRKERITS